MTERLFNTKIKIEKSERKLSENNTWKSEFTPWQELWASIQLGNIAITKTNYIFRVKWKGEFPKNFRVIVNDVIFLPTQTVAIDLKNDMVIFHAVREGDQK